MDGFFGIGISELFMIAVVALIVLGPERLPGAFREVAKFIRMIRNMTNELTSQFGDEFKVLEDLNPQKILRDLVDEPDEKAKTAAKAATKPAAKPAVKSATSTASKPTTPKPATTTKPITTPKPATPKPTVPSKTTATGTTAKPATESAVATVEEAAVAVEDAPIVAAIGAEATTLAGTEPDAPLAETALVAENEGVDAVVADAPVDTLDATVLDAPLAEVSGVDNVVAEAPIVESAPEAWSEEPSILPPALRQRLLAEETDSAPAASEQVAAEFAETGLTVDQTAATARIETIEAEPVEAASIVEIQTPAIDETSETGTTDHPVEALMDTALDTVPATSVPENPSLDIAAPEIDPAEGDNVADDEKPASDLSVLPKRLHVKSTNVNGAHVNGNSTESEP